MRTYDFLPAGFNERISAYAVDFMLVFLIILISIFMPWTNPVRFIISVIIYTLVSIVPNFIKNGQSLGKVYNKTRVIRNDNSDISITRYVIRSYFILFISFMTAGVYPVLAFFILSRRRDKRALHDFLFDTKVVFKESKITG